MIQWPLHIVSAGGYVFNQQGQILLVKTQHRGWDCPGGQIENGENLEEGLLREIKEESGIEAKLVRLGAIYSNIKEKIWVDQKTMVPTMVTFDFVCEYVAGECQTSNETSEVC